MKSINFVFKGSRNLPITVLMRESYYRQGVLITSKGSKQSSVLQSRDLFSENYMKDMNEETSKSNTHLVTRFNRQSCSFIVQKAMDHNEVREMGHQRVKLHKCWCVCEKFQAIHLSFSHVIMICSSVCQDALFHLSGVYKFVNLLGG